MLVLWIMRADARQIHDVFCIGGGRKIKADGSLQPVYRKILKYVFNLSRNSDIKIDIACDIR